ncbi:helicase-related protein [Kitasatospora sp. NPDC059648]|uniref:helicase-related protein n=1 Tax=Kitasatospora sp. NPDC059648 TaxID=3346894 RepID=UPI0036B29F02
MLCNSRLLTEGIDVAAVDAVCSADPKSSVIDIVQAVGRALRQSYRQGKVSWVIIPSTVSLALSQYEREPNPVYANDPGCPRRPDRRAGCPTGCGRYERGRHGVRDAGQDTGTNALLDDPWEAWMTVSMMLLLGPLVLALVVAATAPSSAHRGRPRRATTGARRNGQRARHARTCTRS